MTATQGRPAAGDETGGGTAAGAGEPRERPEAGDTPSAPHPATAAPDRHALSDAPARTDTVAGVVRQWRAVRPDLDTGPMEIIGRVNR